MAETFGDLVGYLDPGLKLTVKGKTYPVPLPSAELGLWTKGMFLLMGQVSSDFDPSATDEEVRDSVKRARERYADLPPEPGGGKLSFERMYLGPVLDEMVDDGAEFPYIQFCAETAWIWVSGGCTAAAEQRAAAYWKAGGRPEARGPANREERRALARKTGTARVDETPSADSTSGTTTPTRSNGNGQGRRSRGRRSSPTGR